jgi:hypothetical protein
MTGETLAKKTKTEKCTSSGVNAGKYPKYFMVAGS